MQPQAGWYPDPADASRQRWWDGVQWTDHVSPPLPTAPAAPVPPGPGYTTAVTPGAGTPYGAPGPYGSGGHYATPSYQPESIAALATTLRVLFILWIIVPLVTVLHLISERSLLGDLQDNPFSVSFADLEASDDRGAALALLSLLLLLVTIVVFLVWMNKAYKNLQAFGAHELRRSTGWSVGGWFIPFANLVLPYQAMRDIWVGSDRTLSDYQRGWWDRGPVAPVLKWWWGLWLVSGFVGTTAVQLQPDFAGDIDQYLTANAVGIVGELFTVAAAVTAMSVVMGVTRRQQEKFADRGITV